LPAPRVHAHARAPQEGKAELRLKALYVTPELLQKNPRVRAALGLLAGRGLLSLIAIDEAHCVTDWGACRKHSMRQREPCGFLL
jgi:bloom syndrome protein